MPATNPGLILTNPIVPRAPLGVMPEHIPGVLPKALLASLPQPPKYRRYFYIMTFSLMFYIPQ